MSPASRRAAEARAHAPGDGTVDLLADRSPGRCGGRRQHPASQAGDRSGGVGGAGEGRTCGLAEGAEEETCGLQLHRGLALTVALEEAQVGRPARELGRPDEADRVELDIVGSESHEIRLPFGLVVAGEHGRGEPRRRGRLRSDQQGLGGDHRAPGGRPHPDSC